MAAVAIADGDRCRPQRRPSRSYGSKNPPSTPRPAVRLTASGIINDMDATADHARTFQHHEIPLDGGPFDILSANNKRVLRYIVNVLLGKSLKATPTLLIDVAAIMIA
ncbi:hypothetical protein BGZ88_002636 [Linnemannia elongata]|nr:hypothetical protein BGZ88_002636 [Linnemannia elongata]